MKVIELIALLEDMNPKAEVWIHDEQSRYVLANRPYEADGEEYCDSEDSPASGDVVISFENT